MPAWYFCIHSSYTFLKCKQRLIYLRSLCSTLLIVMLCILSSLRSCKINKQQSSHFNSFILSVLVSSDFIESYRANRMRSWRCIIRSCRMSLSHRRPKLNQINHFLRSIHLLFKQPTHNNLLILVLLYLQLFMIIQQIIDFPWVNFIVRYSVNKVPSRLLVHDFLSLEQISTHVLLHSFHSVCLARPCLPVGEASDYPSFKQEVNFRLNGTFIETLRCLMLAEGVVELEALVIDEFCNSISSEFALVDYYGRVRARNAVDFSILQFLLK